MIFTSRNSTHTLFSQFMCLLLCNVVNILKKKTHTRTHLTKAFDWRNIRAAGHNSLINVFFFFFLVKCKKCDIFQSKSFDCSQLKFGTYLLIKSKSMMLTVRYFCLGSFFFFFFLIFINDNMNSNLRFFNQFLACGQNTS